MTEFRRVLAVYLVVFLAACGGSGTPTPDPNPTPGPGPNPTPNPNPMPGVVSNNSAVLTGAALGAGTTPNSELQKVIGSSLTGATPTFRLGEAYATRTSADSQTLAWFVPVTNQSSSLQCFVQATSIEFRDSEGTTLAVDELDYVSGSVGVSQGSGSYTDTCLGGGETGYLFGIELEDEVPSVYSLVSAVVVATVGGETGFVAPAARLIPQSYTVATADNESFIVGVRNDGTGAARFGEFSHHFLLDGGGRPLSWDYFRDDATGDLVEAGETRSLAGSFFYDGLASRVQVQVDFRSPAETVTPPELAPSAPTDTAKKLRRYAAWRNEQEGLKQRLLRP